MFISKANCIINLYGIDFAKDMTCNDEGFKCLLY